MASLNRPLSPHLQIYRPQLTSMLSIFHRLTGIGLSLGSITLVLWLAAVAFGPETYQAFYSFFSRFMGKAMLLGWIFCYYFHLANGIRHLCWDMGWGYGLQAVYASGWTVVGFAICLTLLTHLWISG